MIERFAEFWFTPAEGGWAFRPWLAVGRAYLADDAKKAELVKIIVSHVETALLAVIARLLADIILADTYPVYFTGAFSLIDRALLAGLLVLAALFAARIRSATAGLPRIAAPPRPDALVDRFTAESEDIYTLGAVAVGTTIAALCAAGLAVLSLTEGAYGDALASALGAALLGVVAAPNARALMRRIEHGDRS